MAEEYSLSPYGEGALIAETKEEISEASYGRVRGLAAQLAKRGHPAILETIPAYRSLLVVYDPLQSDYQSVEAHVRALAAEASSVQAPAGKIVRIPVCYEGDYAPDLDDVARHAGMQPREVVRLHSSGTYLVYMLGFTPGFPYLGGMTERIAAPRRSSPRVRIPAGSVGIADKQTGIYPVESPGGWNIIGRTPAVLFDYRLDKPTLLAAGEYIRFYPIDPQEFEEIARNAEAGLWRPDTEEFKGEAR